MTKSETRMTNQARVKRLELWHLPPMIIQLASGDFPHPSFSAVCDMPRDDELSRQLGLKLHEVQTLAETAGRPAVALWEEDGGDGHSFEVMYAVKDNSGLQFWNVTYANDIEGPVSELISHSAQGLYFWLFFRLIPAEFFRHGETAYSHLAAAAKAVGFVHLVEVFQLEEHIGYDSDRAKKVAKRSRTIR